MTTYLERLRPLGGRTLVATKRSRIRELLRSRYFSSGWVSLYCVTVSLLAFQNCGQGMGSSEPMVPVQSPFYGKKIYLDANELASLKAQQVQTVPVTYLVNNRCAQQTCALNPGQEKALVCKFISSPRFMDKLKDYVQAYASSVPADTSEEQLEAQLALTQADHDCVIGVSMTRNYTVGSVSNDPLQGAEYHHDVIHTPAALDYFSPDKLDPVKVGVIDTGVDSAHEDMYYPSGWIDWGGNQAKCTGICNYHGTFVAGIIGARRNNAKGGYGIASNAQVRAYRVGDSLGRIDSVELYNALNFFKVADPVEIINLSLGGSWSLDQTVQDAMVRLIADDVLFVIAAGNDGRSIDGVGFYPASFNYPAQINVGSASPITVLDSGVVTAVTATGAIAKDGFSNFSPQLVHIAAPGRAIHSTTLSNSYVNSSGTSFSTPMVTGAMALVKGYLKKAGYVNVSAEILKQILLEGSATQAGLTGFVKDQKYLDLLKLKDATANFLTTMNSSPIQINLISSEAVVVSGNKQVHVKIEIIGGDPAGMQTLRLYTNRAFLTDSYVASCAVTGVRQFCEFDILYQTLVVEASPELYFALSNQSGVLLSSLGIPLSKLNFGVRADSHIEGEVVSVQQGEEYFHVEGWACLVGFPDVIDIEVRSGTATGPVVGNLQTARQARGEFYSRCAAPSIDFGFTYVVPREVYVNSANQKLFFKAVHKGTGKALNLNIYSYQPKFMDPKPAEFTSFVYIDPVIYNGAAQIKITRREYNGWLLNLEGSACYYGVKRPLTLQLSFENDQPLAAIPEAWDGSSGLLTRPLAVQAVSVSTESYSWNIKNLSPLPSNTTAGTVGCGGSFSDISYPCSLTAPKADSTSATTNFVTYLPGISGQFPVPAGAPIGTLPVNYSIKSLLRSLPAVQTIIPDIAMGDGCALPSGFKVSIDMRKHIEAFVSGAAVSWRSDLVTRAQALARVPAAEKSLFQPSPDRTFAELRFAARAINPVLSLPGGAISSQAEQVDPVTGSPTYYSAFYARVFDNANVVLSALSSWMAINPVPPSTYAQVWSDIYSNLRSGQLAKTWVWYTGLNISVSPLNGLSLTTVFSSPLIPTKLPNSTRLFVVIPFDTGSVFGVLGTDFRFEFALNGSTTWFEAPLYAAQQSGSVGNMSGRLMADVDAPAPFNSIQFRIKINGKNTLQLKGVGIVTQ